MIFLPMLLMDNQVNIQNWFQVFSHSLQPYVISYHIISGGYFTHYNLLQIQTQTQTQENSLSHIIPTFLADMLCY